MIQTLIDPRTAVLCAGVLYLIMPTMVWSVLYGRADTPRLVLWCGGGLLMGVVYGLYGLRGAAPDQLTILVANVLAYVSYTVRVTSLRLHLGQPLRGRATLGWLLLAVLAFMGAARVSEPARVVCSLLITTAAAALIALTAWRLGRRSEGRSARLISHAYTLFTLGLLVRLVGQSQTGGDVPTFTAGLDFVFVLFGGLVAMVYSNIGYVGMAFETSRAEELSQAAALASAQALRLAAEQQAQHLRERLDERDEFVRVLAHEVRQPLNNASAALQSAQQVLEAGATDTHVAAGRVARAQAVMNQIVGSLDNTLAATALLSSPERIAGRRDADVTVLLQLSLGDLDVAQRPRVQVERVSRTRTAAMDIGLMRLALRNLLANALAYSGPVAPVVLRITDSDEPLALVFEVLDSGPGVAPELLPRLFERGVRGQHAHPGHGIGLYVVKRVMELHGGSVGLQPNEGGGTVFSLTLPQDV